MKHCRGSLAVEAAFIVPLVIGVIIFIIYIGFFVYNRTVLAGLAGEVVFWGSHALQNGQSVDSDDLNSAFHIFGDERLMLVSSAEFSGKTGNNMSCMIEGLILPDTVFWLPFSDHEREARIRVSAECTVRHPETVIRRTRRIIELKDEEWN